MNRLEPAIVIPLFVIFVVTLGIIYANTSRQRFLNETVAQYTPQESNSPEPTATMTPIPTQSSTPTPTSTPKFNPTPFGKPSASVMAQTTNTNSNSNTLSQFSYPNGKTNSISANLIEIESSDSPDKITNWYKEKIKSLGLNTQSFVTTNNNNNVLNSLAAAGNGINLKVEIKKSASDTVTKVKVSNE